VKTHRICESPRSGLNGTRVERGWLCRSRPDDTKSRHHEAVQQMGSALSSTLRRTKLGSGNPRQVAHSASPPALRAWSFLAQDTHLAADQGIKDSSVHWQADVTRFYFFYFSISDLTYKPPASFACIDCRSCCLSFESRTSPFDRFSAARELRFPDGPVGHTSISKLVCFPAYALSRSHSITSSTILPS